MSRSRVKILCHCNRSDYDHEEAAPPSGMHSDCQLSVEDEDVSSAGGADPSSDSGDESGVATGDDTYEQDLQDIADHSEASSEEEEESCTPASLRKKVLPRGVFTKAALLDMLAEQANFHNVSDAMMEGILDIINLLVLDGGATEPVMASWDAFRKMMDRKTAHVSSLYLLCPHGCRGGALSISKASLGALPAICKRCREDIKLDKKSLPQYMLRHFNVVDQLKTILQLPAARKYVNTNATRIQCLHVPADMKKFPGPKSPKNFRPVFLPLVELKSAQYQVLFASADYEAQVQLLQHQFLGYNGCCKCYQRGKFLSTGTYDWLLPEGKDPPRQKTHTDAMRLGQNARIAGTPQQGFHDIPSLVEVQKECISQTPEDALHLVEGCLKRHLFPILAGGTTLSHDSRTAKHSGATWARWQTQVNKLAMKERHMRIRPALEKILPDFRPCMHSRAVC
eukprot:g65369.t1